MVVIFHNEVMGNSYGRGKRDCHLVFGKYLTLRGSSFTDQDLHNLLIHDRRINCFKEAAGTTGTAKIKRNIKRLHLLPFQTVTSVQGYDSSR